MNFTPRNLKWYRTHCQDMWWSQLDIFLPHLTTSSKDHSLKLLKWSWQKSFSLSSFRETLHSLLELFIGKAGGLLRSVTKRPEVQHYTRRGTCKMSAKMCYTWDIFTLEQGAEIKPTKPNIKIQKVSKIHTNSFKRRGFEQCIWT